jgi:hypothetical protein
VEKLRSGQGTTRNDGGTSALAARARENSGVAERCGEGSRGSGVIMALFGMAPAPNSRLELSLASQTT